MTEMIEDMNLASINLVSENLEELMSEFRLCVAKSLEKHAPMKLSKHLLEIVDHGIAKNYSPLKNQFKTEKEYGVGINKVINGMHTENIKTNTQKTSI